MIGGKVITIDLKASLADIAAKAVQVNRVGDVMMIAARAVDGELKVHFRTKNQKPNKSGFRKSGFWAEVRDSVQSFRAGNDSAIVQVNDPRFNTHVFGATITPKESRALAIPVHPAAYGVRAATFEDLVLLRSGKGKGNTVGVLAKKGSGNGTVLEVYYVLVKKTVVPRDPDALPPDEQLNAAAAGAVQLWIGRNVK